MKIFINIITMKCIAKFFVSAIGDFEEEKKEGKKAKIITK